MKFEGCRSGSLQAFARAAGLMALVLLAPSIANSEEPSKSAVAQPAPQPQGFWGWLAGTKLRYESEVRLANRVPAHTGENSIAAFLASLNGSTRQATAWIKAWIPQEEVTPAHDIVADVKEPPAPQPAPEPVPAEAVFHEPPAAAPVPAPEKPMDVVPATPLTGDAPVESATEAQRPTAPESKPVVTADATATGKSATDVAQAETQKSREERLKDEVARRRAETERQIQDGLKKLEEFDAARRAREAADAEAKLKADADAKAKAKLEADAKAQAEARAKAEAEAKAREAAERAKVEAAARAKAEADAKAKAEADAAQLKAEADAKAQAEARAKADAEAKLKAEAEEKARAEAERLQKAEVAAALHEKPLSEADKKAIDDAVMATARQLDEAEEAERQASDAAKGAGVPRAPVKPEIITREPENELKPARAFAFSDASGGGYAERAPTSKVAPRPAAEDDDRFADPRDVTGPKRSAKAEPELRTSSSYKAKTVQTERFARKQRLAQFKAKRHRGQTVKRVRLGPVRDVAPRPLPVERRHVQVVEEVPYVVVVPSHKVRCVPRREKRGLFVLDR